ncbi:MAG: PAS domain-containing protein [Chloroflexi bacterium]|nr:PAS domain-containing protein [Chloroflexota bacterium]
MYDADVPNEVQDHSPTQGAWVWSLRSGVMRWSPVMFAIFGVSAHQFDTTIENYSLMIYPADRRRVQATLMRGIHEGDAGPLVYRIIRPDGEQRTVEAAIRVEYDMDGVIRRIYGVLTDVTERTTNRTGQASTAVTKPFNATPALIDEWCAFGREMAGRRGLAFECRISDRLPAGVPSTARCSRTSSINCCAMRVSLRRVAKSGCRSPYAIPCLRLKCATPAPASRLTRRFRPCAAIA